MKFHPNQLYHVYNQGNNHQQIYFEDENYLFFLRKVKKYISPYADMLCYCLMHNHFHFLIIPNDEAASSSNAIIPSRSKLGNKMKGTSKVPSIIYQEKLSESIGILLSSYTKAINKRYNQSGSLFRGKTKVKDGWIDGFVTVGGNRKHINFHAENDHAWNCFNYIHANPVEAKLVAKKTDWIYSSARDYAGMRNGKLCNIELARRIFGIE